MIEGPDLDSIIKSTLQEDLGEKGDITSASIFDSSSQSEAIFLAKQDGCLAGIDIASRVFEILDDDILFEKYYSDGDRYLSGAILARVKGKTLNLLAGERSALNFLCKLSGIATMTSKAVALCMGSKAKVSATRKTTPLLRAFEKYAVLCGGGLTHRYGLYDAVLIKDNHIKAAGSIKNAVKSIREKLGNDEKIEVEVENINELREALAENVHTIMLDNFSTVELKEAVLISKSQIILEASGGITFENLREVAETGVDIISLGALTHSVKNSDISLELI